MPKRVATAAADIPGAKAPKCADSSATSSDAMGSAKKRLEELAKKAGLRDTQEIRSVVPCFGCPSGDGWKQSLLRGNVYGFNGHPLQMEVLMGKSSSTRWVPQPCLNSGYGWCFTGIFCIKNTLQQHFEKEHLIFLNWIVCQLMKAGHLEMQTTLLHASFAGILHIVSGHCFFKHTLHCLERTSHILYQKIHLKTQFV